LRYRTVGLTSHRATIPQRETKVACFFVLPSPQRSDEFVESNLAVHAFIWAHVEHWRRMHQRSPGAVRFFKRDQNVYRIVRVSGSSAQCVDERSRAVIAAGFQNATDARECAFRWVHRFCPEATYLPDTGRWRLQDEDGSIHLFCIEASSADDERSAA
jgi:hypothetical protein